MLTPIAVVMLYLIHFFVITPEYVKECCFILIHFPSSIPTKLLHWHLTSSPSRIELSSIILSFQQCHNFPFPNFRYLNIFLLHLAHFTIIIFAYILNPSRPKFTICPDQQPQSPGLKPCFSQVLVRSPIL